ncbi:hypothetical protein ACFQ0B_36375 [Nonomuraea thailandensis]
MAEKLRRVNSGMEVVMAGVSSKGALASQSMGRVKKARTTAMKTVAASRPTVWRII